ncbi:MULTISPECIES: hypothetical protein [unclassified Anabaena]|nr:hypothetical protein [Anabaena sp. UHCC 0399]MEA5567752.1 hypothetical protein [Anabaena sp. UHCC 0399]
MKCRIFEMFRFAQHDSFSIYARGLVCYAIASGGRLRHRTKLAKIAT